MLTLGNGMIIDAPFTTKEECPIQPLYKFAALNVSSLSFYAAI